MGNIVNSSSEEMYVDTPYIVNEGAVMKVKSSGSEAAGSSRNTLKQHFRALVERGHLRSQGAGRGAWYELE